MLDSVESLSNIAAFESSDYEDTAISELKNPRFSLTDRMTLLKIFVATHTYIDFKKDTWNEELLYALPINRLGRSDKPVASVCGGSDQRLYESQPNEMQRDDELLLCHDDRREDASRLNNDFNLIVSNSGYEL